MTSAKGWNLWSEVFGAGLNKTILSQELVSPQSREGQSALSSSKREPVKSNLKIMPS
jgi:hypothetical protein